MNPDELPVAERVDGAQVEFDGKAARRARSAHPADDHDSVLIHVAHAGVPGVRRRLRCTRDLTKYSDDRQDPEYSGTSASAYCACRA